MHQSIRFVALAAAALTLAGCKTSLDGPMNEVEIMRRGERAPELDRLNVFVGSWEGVAEQTEIETGRTTRFQGTSVITWEAGRTALLERSELVRDGEPESHLAVTVWDARHGVYRFWKFDSTGTVVEAESWNYDDAAGLWRTGRVIGDSEMQGTLSVAPDGSQMDTSYVVFRKGEPSRRIAEGKASARRTQ